MGSYSVLSKFKLFKKFDNISDAPVVKFKFKCSVKVCIQLVALRINQNLRSSSPLQKGW